jgi:hypothetical protein
LNFGVLVMLPVWVAEPGCPRRDQRFA